MSATHQPVLLTEAVTQLSVQPAGLYVDGTYGRGGHAGEVLARLGPDGHLLAFDRDPDAVAAAQAAHAGDGRFTIVRGSFTMMERTLAAHGFAGRADGILVDLGVSSPQLDDASRGFSFTADGPLDMRMDPDAGVSAADWLARVPESDLADVLFRYGEERYARRIARAVVVARGDGPIATTARLAELVARAVPTREPGKHPATRTFQAIRIAVNGELDELAAFLPQCPRALRVGGRLCAIAFHSLEDRLVKRFLRGTTESAGPRGLPPPPDAGPVMRPFGKPIRPSKDELARNPRARSAVLRVGERVA